MVNLPEEFFNKVKKKILPQWKVCFLWAMIAGLIAHLYKITNWLPNWDSLVFRYDNQNMLAMGRWFLPVASAPSSFYDLPWLVGLMTIVIYALGAVCICKMFDVRKNTVAALIGATVVSFPNVASVLMYNYVADAYALSFLFACLAALLLIQEKPRYIASAVLIALSVGIYQAYLTVTIMLLLAYLVIRVSQNKAEVKTLLMDCVRFLLTGAFGMALYYGIMTALLKITGTELLEYQGLDNAAALSGIDIWGSLYVIKESFVSYFFDFSDGINTFGVINAIIFAGIALFYLVDVIKNKLGIWKILLLCVFVVALPLGASILSFVNSSVDYHNLMKMGFFVFYLLFILQYENAEGKKVRSWVILIAMVALIFNQVIIANVSYHKLNMAYEKSYGTLIRIADRVEQTEGAIDCDRVLVLGALEGSEPYSANLPPDMTGTTDGWILRADDEIVGQSVLCSALNDYCGKNYTFLAGEEKQALLATEEVSQMENWPAKDSVRVVDDVIVIKLGD